MRHERGANDTDLKNLLCVFIAEWFFRKLGFMFRVIVESYLVRVATSIWVCSPENVLCLSYPYSFWHSLSRCL